MVLEWMLVAQSCPTLCNPMDCSLPGSSVHRIPQARTLEWVDVPFSRGSSQPRDQTQVFCISGRFFTTEPPGNLVEVYNLRKHLTTYKFLVVYLYIYIPYWPKPGGGNSTHSSILAWKTPWIEKPGGLQSMGSQKVKHGLAWKHALN